MSGSASAEVEQLRADNVRLKHLLAREGAGTELRHQVRNTLSQLRAIVRRSAEFDARASDYAAHLEGRLDAILRVQNAIVRDPVEGADLRSLISNELQSCLAQEGEQAHTEGPNVHLTPKAAEVLGLALHELATNSVKFGALGETDGRIDVRWQVTEAEIAATRLEVVWSERGGPPLVGSPTVRGFGIEVLERMLAYQLNAVTTLAFEPSGLRCSIAIPLSPDVGTHSSASSSAFVGEEQDP